MSNTSATGGPLVPASSPAPLLGQALNRFLSAWLVGICGLPGTAVLPRWQPEPANLPTGPWMAFGITKRRADTFAYVGRGIPDIDDSYDELQRHEELTILCSFYDLGVNGQADAFAEMLREGLQVPQNLEPLQLAGMGLVETGELIAVPSLVKERWLYRVDLPLVIRRQIVLRYPVLTLLSADITLEAEVSNDSVITETIEVSQ